MSVSHSRNTGQRQQKNALKLVAALKQCRKTRDLERGKKLHSDALATRCHTDKYVVSALISMYVKCGCMQRAREMFDGTREKDVVMWNSLILGYVENGESLKAMEFFTSMDCEPSHVTYIGALKACAGLAMERASEKQFILEKGMALHRDLQSRGFESNTLVANTLVDMYGKCGCVHHAWDMFHRMIHKSVVTWNSLMLGYVENGESSRALELFANMDCERSHVSYIAALKACANLATERALETGIAIHRQVRDQGLENNLVLANTLLDMYGKCGCMKLAQSVFDNLVHKDVVTWTCLIMGYVENDENMFALSLFKRMNCIPDFVTYIAALKACGGLANEREGTAIHEGLKKCGFDTNLTMGNTLIDMYRKCGNMQRAKEVFDKMIRKDVVSWTCLILGYVESGESFRALDLFRRMDCEPHSFTYVALLKAYGNLAIEDKRLSLESVSAVHKRLKECGFDSNIYVANTLIETYGRCGCMSAAKEVFDTMVHRNVFSWTCLIMGYVENGENTAAMRCFASMDCEPDSLTYVIVLKACGGLGSEGLEKGILIHKKLKELGYESDVIVANAMMGMYIKCGNMQSARDVFEKMSNKSVVTWTSLIMGYVKNEERSIALSLFESMDCEPDRFTYVVALKACEDVEKGVGIHKRLKECRFDADIVVATALIDMYSRCKSTERAREVFDGMTYKDVVMWNSLLQVYVDNGDSSEALHLFMNMECEADCCTYVTVLKACACLSSIRVGSSIHARLCRFGLEGDELAQTALVDLYGKCGSVFIAEEVFNGMHSPDIVSFTALLGGYAALGDTCRVFDIVRCVEAAGLQMNATTFTCILKACSHSGMVEDGKMCLEYMYKYSINPTLEHYTCMVDMLGRANKLEEALCMVKNMPMKANSVTWTTLLDACRKWKNVEVGKIAFDALVELDARRGTTYVLMGEIYGV